MQSSHRPDDADEDEPTSAKSRLSRIQKTVVRIQDGVMTARPHHRNLDLALRVAEHDKDIAGGVISGAVAFRLFLWLLPAALVMAAILGFQADSAES